MMCPTMNMTMGGGIFVSSFTLVAIAFGKKRLFHEKNVFRSLLTHLPPDEKSYESMARCNVCLLYLALRLRGLFTNGDF